MESFLFLAEGERGDAVRFQLESLHAYYIQDFTMSV